MVADSILDGTKKALGIAEDYTVFDPDIIMHINSVFSTLNQLAVGPTAGFAIEDNTATWSSFLGANNPQLNATKTYMYLQVRLYFDPPATSFGIAAFQKNIDEAVWRLNAAADPAFQPTPEEAQLDEKIWNLTGGLEFPPEAPVGAMGVDLDTGALWRNV